MEFDYSKQDSSFYSGPAAAPENPIKEKNIEKEVDYQPELLDFNDAKLTVNKKNKINLPVKLVNINIAGVDELSTLPGIGQKTAENIIAYREKWGHFNKSEDLMNVKGIGNAKYEKIKNIITVK